MFHVSHKFVKQIIMLLLVCILSSKGSNVESCSQGRKFSFWKSLEVCWELNEKNQGHMEVIPVYEVTTGGWACSLLAKSLYRSDIMHLCLPIWRHMASSKLIGHGFINLLHHYYYYISFWFYKCLLQIMKYRYVKFKKVKSVAYSSQGNQTGQLDFCNWLAVRRNNVINITLRQV